MQGQYLIIGSVCILALIILAVIFSFIKKVKFKFYRNKIRDLEIARNRIASTPVLLELSKVEPIIKNDKMEEKYNEWQDRFTDIKENKLSKIDDMLIDLDIYIDKKDYKSCGEKIAKIEVEIYKLKEKAEHLLNEIKNISASEEKYRAIVIGLKSKYRKFNKEYNNHKEIYDDLQEAVEMQLENIERRFLDFEKVMEVSDYTEVVQITSALHDMIEHMEVIVNELPDVLLMARTVIPNRIKEVKETHDALVEDGYPLDYLNLDYNIEESNKNIGLMLDRAKVLNLEGAMFDLTTLLKYYDNLFIDFENEKLSRKSYEEMEPDFKKRIEKTNKLVNDVFDQMDDIKSLYDLTEADTQVVEDVNKVLVVINDDYNKLLAKVDSKSTPYSMVNQELEELTTRLGQMEDDFDTALKSLGNMYEDEQRARAQLEEIKGFLNDSKHNINSFKLPLITNNFFVELSEASDAIDEVVKELDKSPIVIKTLNIRVDNARDLVLKLYNTTEEMVKLAKRAEMSIVYCNRYREDTAVNKLLDKAEKLFEKGNYKEALEKANEAIRTVDKDVQIFE